MQLLDVVLLFAVDVGLLSCAHRLGIVLTLCFFVCVRARIGRVIIVSERRRIATLTSLALGSVKPFCFRVT